MHLHINQISRAVNKKYLHNTEIHSNSDIKISKTLIDILQFQII
jgi:hypothetical protein